MNKCWEENRWELNVRWMVAKEKWRPLLLNLSCPLVDVLLKIHAKVKDICMWTVTISFGKDIFIYICNGSVN